MRIVQQRDGAHHRVVIVERFAHAHEDHIGDLLSARGELAREEARLVEDLGRAEIPRESGLAGRAERARERASGLRRDADRRAVPRVLHEHRLDFFAVVQAKESFGRLIVAAALHDDGLDRRERQPALRQRRPQLFGQRRHLADVLRQFFVGGAVNLRKPIGLEVEGARKLVRIGKAERANLILEPDGAGVSNHDAHCSTIPRRARLARAHRARARRRRRRSRPTACGSP